MTQAKGVFGQLLRTDLPESSYGTDPSSMYCISLPFNTCDIKPSRNLISPVTITGRRDAVLPSQGNIDLSGPVTVPVDQATIGHWMEMLFGRPTTTWTGSAKQHVFQANSVLGSYVLEQGLTDVGLYQKYNGCKVGGMSLRVGGDEELVASFDIMGKRNTPAASTMSGSTTTISLARFNQFNAILQEGGSALDGKVRALELNVNNNLDGSIYTISSGGSAERGDLLEGMCQVTGNVEIMLETHSYYLYAHSGTERSLELKFQSGSFYLDFLINELIYERQGYSITTPEGVWLSMPFQAYYNDASPDKTIIQATLVNTWSAYSGHVS